MVPHGESRRPSARGAALSLALLLTASCGGDDEASSSATAAASSGSQGGGSQGTGSQATGSQATGAGGSSVGGGGNTTAGATSSTGSSTASGQGGGGGSDAIATGTGGAGGAGSGGAGGGTGGAGCVGGPGPIDEVVGLWLAAPGEMDYLSLAQSEGCASGTTCEDEDGTGDCYDLQDLTLVDGRLTYFFTFRRNAEVEVGTADLTLDGAGATLEGMILPRFRGHPRRREDAPGVFDGEAKGEATSAVVHRRVQG